MKSQSEQVSPPSPSPSPPPGGEGISYRPLSLGRGEGNAVGAPRGKRNRYSEAQSFPLSLDGRGPG